MLPEFKNPILSKTILFNLIVAAAAVFPGVSEWVAQNTTIILPVIGAIGIGLRFLTKGKVGWN
jgi:hypothetical protein